MKKRFLLAVVLAALVAGCGRHGGAPVADVPTLTTNTGNAGAHDIP